MRKKGRESRGRADRRAEEISRRKSDRKQGRKRVETGNKLQEERGGRKWRRGGEGKSVTVLLG